ncbi:hypothetical protein [Dysgonomonas macrotermitis]|uniref:Uncharacterized protein n=1 Tax=Dysgonomonas macrotermitis TaxID=1346286 RepID=A0A1M5AWH9_9BACT|nr:hypothetical protein [Dysgonomonas macrotermitis]SHF34624.1 hypothetical protein SAMN05444362_105180 [Dysgonomonas macrotermitis]
MNKAYFISLLTVFITICVLYSCSKEDNDDHTPPTYEILPLDSTATYPPSLVDGDYLYVFTDQDTIFNRIRIRFMDDKKLSSYNIQIRGLKPDATDIIGDTLVVDTINQTVDGVVTTYGFWRKNYQSTKIFGETDIAIIQSIAIDSTRTITNNTTNKPTTKEYPTWMDGPYQFRLSVTDTQGNETIEYYKIFIGKKKYSDFINGN